VVLNFNQRNWEIFGNFFACVNSTKFCYFLGKICKYLDITELGKKKKKKKKKKPAFLFRLQIGHQFLLFVEILKFSPKNVFSKKKKTKRFVKEKK
jgi:hypothetical protein